MAYHVQCNPNTGIINAGTVNKKKDKWVNKTDVTQEALEAVRDHLLYIASLNKLEDGAGYRWECEEKGKAIMLTAKIVSIDEGMETEAPAEEVSEPETKTEE